MSGLSERTLLGALALEKNEALACADKQLLSLQSSQQESEVVINDYVYKLTLLGQEKRLINELRKKSGRSKEDLEQYDRALSRSEAILRSLRFAELGPFKDVIQHVAQQYDQHTPDRLAAWLPAQIKSSLKKAITQSIAEVNRDRVIYLKGGLSMGDSLSTAQRESLAQDQQLVESFLTKSEKSGTDITATWCRVNAKYGEGAQYRDNILMGVSLLSLPASGLLRLGAASALSAGKGVAGLGNLSVRSAHILKVSAGVAGGALTASQLYKACLNERTELGVEVTKEKNTESCEVNILKSQAQENCSLMATLSVLSIPLNVKGTQEAFTALTRNETTRNAAIKKAHEIGRGQVEEDGTAAKVGNYTFAQKRKKARTLQEARILRSERRKLFESGKVGDGDYIDELIKIEDEIVSLEKSAWKTQGASKGLTDDLIALRAKLDEAMDAPADEMSQRIAKLREDVALVGKTKAPTAVNVSSTVARLEDVIENPQSLRQGKVIQSKNTVRAYERILEDFLKFLSGQNLNSVQPIAIGKYLTSIAETSGIASYNLTRSALSSFFDFLIRSGEVASNPVSAFKTKTNKNTSIKLIPNEELCRKIVSAEKDLTKQIMLHLTFVLGLRISEVLSLKPQSFKTDLNGSGFLHVVGKGSKPRDIT